MKKDNVAGSEVASSNAQHRKWLKEMGKIVIELTDVKLDYFPACTGVPCFAAHGSIYKAAARAGDVYVYYRRESRETATFRVYSAEGVGELRDSEAIERATKIAEFHGIKEAKASNYRPHFIAFQKLIVARGW